MKEEEMLKLVIFRSELIYSFEMSGFDIKLMELCRCVIERGVKYFVVATNF